jgi:hypothetical protein
MPQAEISLGVNTKDRTNSMKIPNKEAIKNNFCGFDCISL